MTKFRLLLFCILFSVVAFTQKNPELVDIPMQVYVNHGKNDFSSIIYRDSTLKEKVAFLHSHDELQHDLSVRTNTFAEYWEVFKKQWHFIKFRKNAAPLLLFEGIKNYYDERGYVQLYDMSKKQRHQLVYSSVGKLLAYKRQPFTEGLILYVHQYPCCKSASHNIKIIRQLDGKIIVSERFFVGRDIGDMVGPFFPKKGINSPNYYVLKKRTALRWSPAVVNKDAFKGWAQTNVIIHYNKGAIYKILGKQDGWEFVIFFSGIAKEQSRVINYTNFEFTGVYGWIKV